MYPLVQAIELSSLASLSLAGLLLRR